MMKDPKYPNDPPLKKGEWRDYSPDIEFEDGELEALVAQAEERLAKEKSDRESTQGCSADPGQPAITPQSSVGRARWPILGSEEQLPPSSPQLQCPECAFENDNPEHLAEHLIQSHKYSLSTAWYAAGQENERLYPRFRAPEGTFTVLGVDKSIPTGNVIASCITFNEAVLAADAAAGSYPEIYVYDDSGKERHKVVFKSHDEKEKLNNTREDKTVAKSSEASNGNSEPRKVIIVTMPKFKKRRPEPS
jgi:hypothetical protein